MVLCCRETVVIYVLDCSCLLCPAQVLQQYMHGNTASSSANKRAPVLIAVLCGLPGSGKSSLCTGIARIAPKHDVAVHHLCLDALLKRYTKAEKEHSPHGQDTICQAVAQSTAAAAGGAEAEQQHAAAQQQDEFPFTAEAWQASRQRLLQETQLLLQQQQQQQHRHSSVLLIDDINHYRSMRYEFVQLARTHGAAFVQLYMDCSTDLALQRNSQRHGLDAVPAAVITRLAAAFEQPQPDKHHWEADVTLTVHCSSGRVTQPAAHQCSPLTAAKKDGTLETTSATAAGEAEPLAEAAWRALLSAWGPPLPPPPSEAELAARRAAGSAANAASGLHALDLASRSMLHHTLAACTQDERAGAAAALNAHRKQLLERLRQQQQARPADGAADVAADGEVQQLLDAFKQLCDEYM